MVKSQSPDPPFISHFAIIQGEMGIFLTSSVLKERLFILKWGRISPESDTSFGVIFTTSQGVYGPFPCCRSRMRVPP